MDKGDHFLPFHERANGLLYNNWSGGLADVHDKEIKLEQKHYEGILKIILSRDEEVSKQYIEYQKGKNTFFFVSVHTIMATLQIRGNLLQDCQTDTLRGDVS
jgi:hypothetical protein